MHAGIDYPWDPRERPNLVAIYHPAWEAATLGMQPSLFADTFARTTGLGARWRAESGTWTISANGTLSCSVDGGRLRALDEDGNNLRMFNGRVSLKSIKSGTGTSAGPRGRVIDNQNFIFVEYNNTTVLLRKRSGGTNTTLTSWALAYTTPAAPIIELVMLEDDLTVLVNGVTLGSYTLTTGDAAKFGTASTPVADGVGIYWGSGASNVDDFVCSEYPVVSSMMLDQITDFGPNGYHMLQAATAKQPRLFHDGTRWVFRGDGVNDIAVYTAASALSLATKGHVYVAVPFIKSVGATRAFLASGDEGSANRFLEMGIDGTAFYISQNNSGTQDKVTGDTVLARFTPYLMEFASTDTLWKGWVNDVAQTLSVAGGGGNNGKWFGDTGLRDSASILGKKVSTESNNASYAGPIMVFDGDPHHDTDRRLHLRWMNDEMALDVRITP